MIEPFADTDQPAADDLVWRYMDFTQLVDLLANRHLFFARLDRLDDPYEGARTRAEARLARSPYVRFDRDTDLRRFVYVNCWYLAPHESLAMWRIYCRSPEGVAVRSTPARLAAALANEPRRISAGRVRYLDYDRERRAKPDGLLPFMCKRRSFEFENELRLLHYDEAAHDGGEPEGPPGFSARVDVNELIQDVVLAPSSGGWLVELVRMVANKFGVDVPVRTSDLENEPDW